MRKFEDDFNFEENEIPILVTDLRVSVFSLLYWANTYKELWTDEDLELFWQVKLHYPLEGFLKQRFQLVFVDDLKYKSTKNYWRNDYLQKAEGDFPIYKGNRKPQDRPEMYYRLHEAAARFAEKHNIPHLKSRGFEADDFAGYISKFTKEMGGIGRKVILFTVDSDWGQLVDDYSDIIFYYSNMPAWKSRLRNEDVMKQWLAERQNMFLNEMSEIVNYKVEKGDKSDNLVPGSPQEVIDLLHPGKEIPKKYKNTIEKILKGRVIPHTNVLKGLKAKNEINRRIIEYVQSN